MCYIHGKGPDNGSPGVPVMNLRTIMCGRCGCILFYTGDNCIFCPSALEILPDVTWNLEVDNKAVCKINIDNINGEVVEAPVTTILMMRICDTVLTGLPDESSVRDALLKMMAKECYYESQKGG